MAKKTAVKTEKRRGRPPVKEPRTAVLSIPLTAKERTAILDRGGSRWAREVILAAL